MPDATFQCLPLGDERATRRTSRSWRLSTETGHYVDAPCGSVIGTSARALKWAFQAENVGRVRDDFGRADQSPKRPRGVFVGSLFA